MASKQQIRRENQTDERSSAQVEKDRVPKMASQFEAMAEKSPETTVTAAEGKGGRERGEARDTKNSGTAIDGAQQHPVKVGGVEFCGGQAPTPGHQVFKEKPGGVEFEAASGGGLGRNNNDDEILEEIGKARQEAQQNSINSLRAAQEKYETAKERASHALGTAGEKAKGTTKEGSRYVLDKANAAKDTALQKGQQAYEMTKDTLSGAGKTTKDYTAPKTDQAKDALTKAGEVAKEYTLSAKDRGAELSKSAASYAGQKAVEAKDATVEGGKVAAQYAGKVAETVKDKATVAGWEAARFTAEKAAGATNVAAGVAATAAGYAGKTAIAAKDVVAGAGNSAAGYAGDKLAAAKDYVVSAEESAAEYAARKKAEAQREAQAKKPADSKGEGGGGSIFGRKQEAASGGEGGKTREMAVGAPKVVVSEGGGEESGGILQAIGETIVEIGQTTKGLVIGSPNDDDDLRQSYDDDTAGATGRSEEMRGRVREGKK
ncbi:hypothetical protein DM860_008848 [Cuscuta australis]|uniref:Seed biotin-containing protein SBP65 n=1 Tax=Cuscuta australis TaxID=267555 RepID=A0A328D809_9ASTE|nr:hypothetical protein DM860_008848 [Cuscuta australis]